ELAEPGNGATRRWSISTSVAPGSKPRSASAAVPAGPAPLVALFWTGIVAPFITGSLWSNCSAVVPAPDLLIRSRLILNTGFVPTSSAVGMAEPVTITRSTSAVWSWPDVFGGKTMENPAVAARATGRNPSLSNAFTSHLNCHARRSKEFAAKFASLIHGQNRTLRLPSTQYRHAVILCLNR